MDITQYNAIKALFYSGKHTLGTISRMTGVGKTKLSSAIRIMAQMKKEPESLSIIDGKCVITEQMMIDRSSDEEIIEKYNTKCMSKPDFKQRLTMEINAMLCELHRA